MGKKIKVNEKYRYKPLLVVFHTIIGLLVSGVFLGVLVAWYDKEVRFPAKLGVEYSKTGSYVLESFQTAMNSYDVDGLKGLNKNSLLAEEVKYQNSNPVREEFVKDVLSIVSIDYPEVTVKNVHGGDYYERGGFGVPILKSSPVLSSNEKVIASYIDYSALPLDKETIKELVESSSIDLSSPDVRGRVIDLYSEWVSTLIKEGDYPVKRVEDFDSLLTGEYGKSAFSLVEGADSRWDSILFASDEFRASLDLFSELVLNELGRLRESPDWLSWDKGGRKGKEPFKWVTTDFIPYGWVGLSAMELSQTKKGGYVIPYPVGDGTFENPAGVGTPIVTKALVKGSDGSDFLVDVRVTLKKVSYGSDAITDLISRDNRNRGLDPSSPTKYVYTEWVVESLSDKTFTLYEDSSLADGRGNLSGRTGVMYGLGDTYTFQPYDVVEFQSWGSSTELPEKHLIWGKSFDKSVSPVWFKVLKLSDSKLEIPSNPVSTKDISANKNEEATESEE